MLEELELVRRRTMQRENRLESYHEGRHQTMPLLINGRDWQWVVVYWAYVR